MLTDLEGQIERITYTNEENGFTIAKVRVRGRRDVVTVVGNLMSPAPGEVLKMTGEWSSHPKYGEQFKVSYYKTEIPATVHGIRKYLGSGLIKGIGPVMAERIVKKFGIRTLDIIENEIDKLSEVDGVGTKRIEMIRKAWTDQREIRDVMLFLQAHGIGSGYATKIFKQYGYNSISVVKKNPYRLATEIFGIGFLTADRIAEKLGFDKSSMMRVEAGIIYVLHQLAEEGHVFYPYEILIDKCRDILDVNREVLASAMANLSLTQQIVIEDLNKAFEEFRMNNKAVYLANFFRSESGISERMAILISTLKSIRRIDSEKAVEWVQRQLSITLAEKQVEAIRCAIENKAMVITGGPGTGKTTIIHAILKIFSRLNIQIMLAAPTGRAAKRMGETTGFDARTIHRLLEFSIQKGGFQRNEKNPLECDLLIIDEVSMVDTVLMYTLLKAVPSHTTLILVGDVNQLPSVGPGNVLKDIIASAAVPVVELNEIFRQARQSRIVVNAHKVNQGIIPYFKETDHPTDCFFIEQEDPNRVLEIILELIRERIPRRFGFDPVDDIQVLTPMHKGVIGAQNLNVELQNILNPGDSGVIRSGMTFRVDDKVMQVKNNYEKDIFNGDIGRIKHIRQEDQEVIISFEGRDIIYDYPDLDEIVLAYAVSVHKSQGSEYPAVVIPVHTQHFILLQRNLIYTAITRGRNLVVMVGTKKALAIGVKNDKTEKRYTYLQYRLQNLKK
jgi:exodeoxyribonuclease V alpha subunit